MDTDDNTLEWLESLLESASASEQELDALLANCPVSDIPPYIAGNLAHGLREVANDRDTLLKRITLLERALEADPGETSEIWLAQQRYALAFSLCKLNALEQRSTPERLAACLRHSGRSVVELLRLGDPLRAAHAQALYCETLVELPESQGGGRDNALRLMRAALHDSSLSHATSARAVLFLALAELCSPAGLLLSLAHRREAKQSLERAAELFTLGLNAIDPFEYDGNLERCVTSCYLRAHLEWEEMTAGVGGDANVALSWLERGMDIARARQAPGLLVQAAHLIVEILEKMERPPETALRWLDHALADIPEDLLPWPMGVMLQLQRARLLRQRAQGTSQEEYAHCVQSLEAALAPPSPPLPPSLVAVVTEELVEQHLAHNRLDEAVAAAQSWEKSGHGAFPPVATAQLLRLALRALLQRDSGRDRLNACKYLTRLLDLEVSVQHDNGLHVQVLHHVALAAADWIERAATHWTKADISRAPWTRLLALWKGLPENTWGSHASLRLKILLDSVRSKVDDQPPPEECLERLVSLANSPELMDAGSEGVHLTALQTAFFFALDTLGAAHEKTQAVARQLEPLAMGPIEGGTYEARVAGLSDLAAIRLAAPEVGSLRHAQAALRLLEFARQNYPLESLSHEVRELWHLHQLRARLRILKGEITRPADEVLAVADDLLRDILTTPESSRNRLVEQLCQLLWTFPALDFAPLRARAEALATQFGFAELLQRRDEISEALRNSASDSTTPELAAREQAPSGEEVSPELLASLTRAEGLAAAARAVHPLAVEALQMLEPLRSRSTGRTKARVYRALGVAWTYHPSGQRREALERAHEAFQNALQIWPSDEFEKRVELSLEYAEALWLYVTFDSNIVDSARALLSLLPEDSRLKEIPLLRSKVAFQLGLLERYDVRGRTPEQAQRAAIPHLRAALAWYPDDAPVAHRFAYLLSLANAQRDLYRMDGNNERMAEKAEAGYRAALELAASSGEIVDMEVARAQKCLADILVARKVPAGLDEARVLLRKALEVRTARRERMLRAETLASVVQLELMCHALGLPCQVSDAREAALEGLGLISATSDAPQHAELTRLLQLVEAWRIKAGAPQDAESRHTAEDIADQLLERLNQQVPTDGRNDMRASVVEWLRGDHERSPRLRAMGTALETLRRLLPNADLMRADTSALHQWLDQCETLLQENTRLPNAVADANSLCLLLSVAWIHQSEPWPLELWRRAVQMVRAVIQCPGFVQLGWVEKVGTRATLGQLLANDQFHKRANSEEWFEGITLLRQVLSEVESRFPEAEVDFPDYALALWNALYHAPGPGQRDRLEEVLALGERALEIAKRHNQTACWQSLLLNQATLLHRLSDEDPTLHERTLASEDALTVSLRETGTLHNLANVLSNRAWTVIKTGTASQEMLNGCLRDLQEAKQITDAHPELFESPGSILDHLGSCHRQLAKFEPHAGHVEKALENHKAATALWEAQGVPVEASRGLHNGALLLLEYGSGVERMEGVTWLLKALELRKGRPDLEWETLRLLVCFRTATGWPNASGVTDAWILERFEALIPELRSSDRPAGLLSAISLRMRYLSAVEDMSSNHGLKRLQGMLEEGLDDAERCWLEAATLESQHTYSHTLGELSAWRVVVGQRLGEKPKQLLRHAARGRARTLALQRAARSSLPVAGEALNWMDLQNEREQLAADPEAHASARLLEVERALQDIVRRSGSEILSSVTGKVITRGAVEARLRQSPGTAFIELSHSALGSVAVIASLSRAGALELEARSLEVTDAELEHWMTSRSSDKNPDAPPGWIEILERLGTETEGRGTDDAWLETAEQCAEELVGILMVLHHRVIGPAVHGLREKGVRRLVFSVQSPLDILPLAAACWRDGHQRVRYLIEDFEAVSLTPSCEVFLSSETAPVTPGDALLVAVDAHQKLPGFSERMKALEGLLKEGGHHITLLGGRGASGSGAVATVESVHRALQRADVAHLLCHGIYDESDLIRAGLLLEDGELLSCARLIQSPERLHASLVVVSACQSGRSRSGHAGGEWLGFSGALLRAGAKSVVAALWDVNYAASAHVLEQLHEALLEHPEPAVALSRAMRLCLNAARLAPSNERIRHPLLESLRGARRTRAAHLLAMPMLWGQFGVLEG